MRKGIRDRLRGFRFFLMEDISVFKARKASRGWLIIFQSKIHKETNSMMRLTNLLNDARCTFWPT